MVSDVRVRVSVHLSEKTAFVFYLSFLYFRFCLNYNFKKLISDDKTTICCLVFLLFSCTVNPPDCVPAQGSDRAADPFKPEPLCERTVRFHIEE